MSKENQKLKIKYQNGKSKIKTWHFESDFFF